MENPKRVVSKAQILDRVWDYDFGGQANIVELYISYLRKKVDASAPAHDPHRPRRGLRHQTGGLSRAHLSGCRPAPDAAAGCNPSTWHLRTRLVLVAMALLVAICGAMGLFSYASMDSFLTRQLDEQLERGLCTVQRLRPAPARQPGRQAGSPWTRRGQRVGTLSPGSRTGRSAARASWPPTPPVPRCRRRTTRSSWASARDGVPVDRTLSTGAYRLVATQTPYGDIIVTGLPLAEKQNTLTLPGLDHHHRVAGRTSS